MTRKIEDNLKKIAKAKKVFLDTVNKPTLSAWLDLKISSFNDMAYALEQITSTKLNKVVIERLKTLDKKDVDGYNKLKNHITPRKGAKATETKTPGTTLLVTINAFVDVLTEIRSNLDTLFADNIITIHNSRISHLMILGAMWDAKILDQYVRFTISLLTTPEGDHLKPYRAKFLKENAEKVGNLITTTYNNSGKYKITTVIKELSAKSINLLLFDDQNKPGITANDRIDLGPTATGFFESGLSGINIFRMLNEWMTKRAHEEYIEQKQLRDWMNSKIKLLKMDADKADKQSKDYQKQKRIIDTYEGMVDDLDKKVKAYEKSVTK